MKKLLIVKTGSTFPRPAARWGDFEHWIMGAARRAPEYFEVCRVADGAPLPARKLYAGAILTGSHAMVTDRAAWSEYLASRMRVWVDAGYPILGICYGHQLLARTLGGRVDYHPRGREIGRVPIGLTPAGVRDPLLGSLPGRFSAHVSHAQSALVLPTSATLLAGNEFEPHQAVRFGERAWGVQFHPEFSAAVMCVYIWARAADLRAAGRDPFAMIAEAGETPEAAELLRAFVRLTLSGDGG